MDTSTINLLISVGALIFGLVTWFIYQRKTRGAREEKEERAYKETRASLIKLLAQGDEEIEASVVDAIINSKYKACGLDVAPIGIVSKILDDVVAEFTDSIFIPPERSKYLIKKSMLLKERLEGRKLDLEEALKNWRSVSIPAIILRSSFIASAILFFGLLVVIISLVYVSGAAENSIMYLIAILVLTLIASFSDFKASWDKRRTSAQSLYSVLEDNAIKALKEILPNADIERNARIEQEGQLAQVDLVIEENGQKLPVEIKHGFIKMHTIDQIADVMQKIGSNKGLIITTSRLGDEVKNLSRQRSIITIDDVTSQRDIINRLKNTKLFD
jgi:uncharacterized membrane protein YiaA